MLHLTMMLVVQVIQHHMVGWRDSDEQKGHRGTLSCIMEGLRKTMKNLKSG